MKTKTFVAYGLIGVALYLWLTQSGRNIAAQLGTEIMKLTDSGLQLIAKFEGFSPYPYKDAQGQSVGFGHFILPSDTFTYPMTEAQAYDLLKQDAAKADAAVTRLVKVPLTSNQHDALVSLVYNIGEGNFGRSTLLRMLNAGDYNSAAAQFSVWKKSGGEVITALVNRRAREQDVFLTT
jgi:lysozyme